VLFLTFDLKSFCFIPPIIGILLGILKLDFDVIIIHVEACKDIKRIIDIVKGTNNHHRVEAAFKGLALSLREAWEIDLRLIYKLKKDGSNFFKVARKIK
jgi:hypothetical protein